MCALALGVWFCTSEARSAKAEQPLLGDTETSQLVVMLKWDGPAGHGATMPMGVEPAAWQEADSTAPAYQLVQAMPAEAQWISPSVEGVPYGVPYGAVEVPLDDPAFAGPVITDAYPCEPENWFWQVLPSGLIYHSYWAGVHEPRLSIVAMDEQGSQAFWDGTVGGRVGLVRYGNGQAIFPQGWQLDVEAAAILRMTLDEIRDFEMADYRVGVPLTYGIDNWQFKFAGYHLSSHLGDEFAIANPGSLNDRINYVRDALVLGVSYYPVAAVRLYSEAAYAFNVDGGAKPWEFQFGTEIARPGPTGIHGTPFLAINGHLREEHDFGGDITTQAGWLWRGQTGQVVRAGVHYFNGKSSQYQIFDENEQQIGVGLWYDF